MRRKPRRKCFENTEQDVVFVFLSNLTGLWGVSGRFKSMSFESQHLRFSVDLSSSKAGHEAIVAHMDGELKHLEHVKEYLNKRVKVELDYASALARINTAASKVVTDNDRESPIRKVSILIQFRITCVRVRVYNNYYVSHISLNISAWREFRLHDFDSRVGSAWCENRCGFVDASNLCTWIVLVLSVCFVKLFIFYTSCNRVY